MKVGILGAGNIGGVMARTLNGMKEAQAYAVASRSQEKAEKFAEKFGIPKAYGSYEELAADPEVELIYVATPHSHHYSHMKLCLEHRKPVLCEKAFTQNAAQAEEILNLARREKIFCAEAIWTRYMPLADTIRQLLERGAIGRPYMLTANLGYLLEDVERIRKPELAGGALLDLGIYPLTFASMFFGDDIVKIDSASIPLETGVDGQDSITLTYRDGRMAILHCTARALTDRQGVISGSEGFLTVENINNFQKVEVYDRNRNLLQTIPCPKQITGYEYEVLAAREALMAGEIQCPQMPHSESLFMMKLMDSIRSQWGLRYPNEQ